MAGMELPANLSDVNPRKAAQLRALIAADVVKSPGGQTLLNHLHRLHVHTLQLPSVRPYPAPLRSLLEQTLLDQAVSRALRTASILNWCRELRTVYPLRVSGEGNSLLHSVSLYMWGVQDTDLVLQKTFHHALVNAHSVNFKLRLQAEYLREQGLADVAPLHHSEIWDQEWQNVIASADPESAAGQAVTNIYQDVHLFVLANVIRRPIIVVVGISEKSLENTSSRKTSSPAGIYLPLHWPPLQCCTCPVLLGYEHHSFSPLITINDIGPEINAFPLAVPSKSGSVELPIRFLLDSEKVNGKQLLSDYLIEISVPDCNGVEFVNAARLLINPLPDDLNLVQDYFQLVNHRYKSWQESSDNVRKNWHEGDFDFLSTLSIVEEKCLTHGCPYFCSKFTKPFCHTCRDAFQGEEMPPDLNNQREGDGEGVDKQFNKDDITMLAAGTSLYSETNALKCKDSECLFTGSETLLGFCPSCFHKRGHMDSPERGGNSGKVVNRRMDLLGQRCSECKQEVKTFGWCYLCLRRTDAFTLTQGTSGQSSSELHQAAKASTGGQMIGSVHGQGLQVSQVTPHGKCKTTGCQYFGAEDRSGLCTSCFLKHLESLGASAIRDPGHGDLSPLAPQRQLAQISSRLRNMSICHTFDCRMLANPTHSGYCDKCYISSQAKYSHKVHMASCSPADQHTWSAILPLSPSTKPANKQEASDRATREPVVLELEENGHLQNLQTHNSSSPDHLQLKPGKHVCRTHGCEHFGNAKCDGYCNACFASSVKQRK